MARWLPFPLMSAALLILWLLLNQTLTLAHILLGSLIALVGGWTLTLIELPKFRMRRLGSLVRLATAVAADIVRSNVAVARIILTGGGRERTSGFVDIPLELRNPYALAALGCIITSTPGTLWVGFDQTSGMLTIHVLDLVDEDEWIRTIKDRYERPLLEILV
jgi:multicomponent K+:H+ antiporter subunit E